VLLLACGREGTGDGDEHDFFGLEVWTGMLVSGWFGLRVWILVQMPKGMPG
jgi:hypothetical protein